MKNITEIIEPITDLVIVIIDHGDGTLSSMLKSTYEAQQVEHLTDVVKQNYEQITQTTCSTNPRF